VPAGADDVPGDLVAGHRDQREFRQPGACVGAQVVDQPCLDRVGRRGSGVLGRDRRRPPPRVRERGEVHRADGVDVGRALAADEHPAHPGTRRGGRHANFTRTL
jgi:hypothetical protein